MTRERAVRRKPADEQVDGRIAELLFDAHAEIGEAAIWNEQQGVLYWVDIPRGLVHQFDPSNGFDLQWPVGSAVGTVVPREKGGLVLAVEAGFSVMDPLSGETQLMAEVESDTPGNRMNDGKCDNHGRLWAGTMALDISPGAGTLYRLDSDWSVHPMLSEVTCSNGIAWSCDDQLMYFADSVTHRVDAFDFDGASGTIRNRRPFVAIAERLGNPDGMTVDSEGGVWVALWDGWAVHRYGSDGRLDYVVSVPVRRVTSCAFGGRDLRDLFITTASAGISESDGQPHAGGLFRARPGVAGVPANLFLG